MIYYLYINIIYNNNILMSQNINFYENDNVKKKNPQRDDQQLEFTGIKLRSRNLLCGASGSAKQMS